MVMGQAMRAKVGPDSRLFFYRDDRMLAAEFDLSARLRLGSPILVPDNVPDLGGGAPVGDVSPAGLMAFRRTHRSATWSGCRVRASKSRSTARHAAT